MKENSERAGNAVRSFVQTDRLHRCMFDSVMQSTGLSRSQHWTLVYLRKHGEMGSQKELADFLELTPAAVTGILKRLEQLGYVLRTVSELDNRNHRICLTEQGEALVEKTRLAFHTIDMQMLEGLSESQLDTFIECHRVIQENLRRMSEKRLQKSSEE